jgi:hypothetical protein
MTAMASDGNSAKEQELKAAYIYNFAKFTTWPDSRFSSSTAPLVIGVMGSEPVATALATQVRNHSVNGRSVDVRLMTPDQDIGALHVLYIATANGETLPRLQHALPAPGLLTIGDSEKFLAAGGVIRFVIDGDRLQFQIDVTAAQRAQISLSSQLLMLARSVRK